MGMKLRKYFRLKRLKIIIKWIESTPTKKCIKAISKPLKS